MSNKHTHSDLFEQALKAFPHSLEPTSITQGVLESADSTIEYAEEFIFEAGKLFDEALLAGGWIEYRQIDNDITITAFFGIARNGDWQNGRILREYEALQGYYDIGTRQWDLQIDTY